MLTLEVFSTTISQTLILSFRFVQWSFPGAIGPKLSKICIQDFSSTFSSPSTIGRHLFQIWKDQSPRPKWCDHASLPLQSPSDLPVQYRLMHAVTSAEQLTLHSVKARDPFGRPGHCTGWSCSSLYVAKWRFAEFIRSIVLCGAGSARVDGHGI